MTLDQFLRENPPADMPFFPGARVTEDFGLRKEKVVLDMGASPFHLGVDRAGGQLIEMPFDGHVYWRLVGGVAGSVLSLIPDGFKLEIQVFHTLHHDRHVRNYEERFLTGEPLPLMPSNIGLASGVHTHTEVIMPFDSTTFERFKGERLLVDRGIVDTDEIGRRYRELGFDADEVERVTVRCIQQVKTWTMTEYGEHFAIRKSLPGYRKPQWGAGPTFHVDSMYLLEI